MPKVVGSLDVEKATILSKRKTRFARDRNKPRKIPLGLIRSFAAMDKIELEHSIDASLLGKPIVYVGKTSNHQHDADKPHLDGLFGKKFRNRVIEAGPQLLGASCLPTVCWVGMVEFTEGEPYVDPRLAGPSLNSPWLSRGILLDTPRADRDIQRAIKRGDLEEVRFNPGDVLYLPGDTFHSSDGEADISDMPEFRLLYGQMFLPDKSL